jgi:hypothetical protein
MRVEARELLIGVMDGLVPVIVEQMIGEGRTRATIVSGGVGWMRIMTKN